MIYKYLDGFEMKKLVLMMILCLSLFWGNSSNSNPAELGDYIVIAWNDLGMHCSNKDFSTLVVLPPYNNLIAQVIKRGANGNFPQIVTSGVKVTYEIPGNTYSVGKTNFWDYAQKLFGNKLENNIGLKGAGLTGEMVVSGSRFRVEGIPVTPYTDADLANEDPYQLALVKVYDMQGNLLASTKPVIPVSNEISCVSSGCHASEQAILNKHEQEEGFDPNNKPILCASCHASNALGTTGKGDAGPLSYRIHNKHANKTTDCYKCHPGQKTQCLRGAMFRGGKKCIDCHGSMSQVASSIQSGRRPWLDEPSCSKSGCHATDFSPNTGKLYRESQGHGGMFCSSCHGSPHAEYPSANPRDNQQMIDLQGHEGKLIECWVCHGNTPAGEGPHGYIAPNDVADDPSHLDIRVYPNPFSDIIYIQKQNINDKIELFSINGERVLVGVSIHTNNPFEEKYDLSNLQNGIYFIKAGKLYEKIVKN
jgi:hypothetical protein